MPVRAKQIPLSIKQVDIGPGFLGDRVVTNNRKSVVAQYNKCLDTGRIEAIKLQWRDGDPNRPHYFWDSDVAKWVQAACWSLMKKRNKALAQRVEEVVDMFIASQQDDGYINSYFSTFTDQKRWSNVMIKHELYCIGHLIEAAVAHHEYSGDERFLNAMCRCADYVASVFGPGRKQIQGYPGHQEIELALVELYRVTGVDRYLNLAKCFLDERGRNSGEYFRRQIEANQVHHQSADRQLEEFQAHLPVREQSEAVGHSVRALYMYSAMVDVAVETGDAELMAACRKLFDNITTRRMYITGGVGSTPQGETFTYDYDLPNMTGYGETCAAISLVFFAHRMLLAELDGKYADIIERSLYNGVLSGISLSGDKYFYANLLRVEPERVNWAGWHSIHSERQRWMDCSCCPSNVSRLLASLQRYIYTCDERGAMYVHLYANSTAQTCIKDIDIRLTQETNYPWDGSVKIVVDPARVCEFSLKLRIPQWCDRYKVKLNGRVIKNVPVRKGYLAIRRQFKSGDVVELSLEMRPVKIAAHPGVVEDTGKIAIQRGPLVYCLEECDNSADVLAMAIPTSSELTERMDRKLFGGCVVIEGRGIVKSSARWANKLYQPAARTAQRKVKFKAVPYSLWCNRKPGRMTVWVPES